ncbi:hypothetical protein HMPREF1989_00791 [Porphyromonas gingivalis F0566]|nr:hypothetical protein HMPREF1989_00791 [Porphyromonas gingivalis F0566]
MRKNTQKAIKRANDTLTIVRRPNQKASSIFKWFCQKTALSRICH